MHAQSFIYFDVPATLLAYSEAVLARLGYLHPAWKLCMTERGIATPQPLAAAETDMRREILYAFYREKVFAETLPMRQALLDAVTQP